MVIRRKGGNLLDLILMVQLMICFSLLLSPASAYAEIYKWVDEKGSIHFTEDPSTIPEKYRENIQRRSLEEDRTLEKSKLSKPLLFEFTIKTEYLGLKYIVGHMVNNTNTLIRSADMEVNCYDENGVQIESVTVFSRNLEPGVKSEFRRIIDRRTKNLKVMKLSYY